MHARGAAKAGRKSKKKFAVKSTVCSAALRQISRIHGCRHRHTANWLFIVSMCITGQESNRGNADSSPLAGEEDAEGEAVCQDIDAMLASRGMQPKAACELVCQLAAHGRLGLGICARMIWPPP